MSNKGTQRKNKVEMDYSLVRLMQKDEPLAVYKKEILGKLSVKYLDPFEKVGKEKILQGLPNDNSNDGNFIELWSEEELIYFTRMNRLHLEQGYLVEFTVPRSTKIKQSVNNLSEQELRDLVSAPFLKLQKTVDKMTSEAALQRIVRVAEEEDRPVKTMEFLKEKLSKIQMGE